MLVRLLSVVLLSVMAGCQFVTDRGPLVARSTGASLPAIQPPLFEPSPVHSRSDAYPVIDNSRTAAVLDCWLQDSTYVESVQPCNGAQFIRLPPIDDSTYSEWLTVQSWDIGPSIRRDHANFYSRKSLGLLAAGFSVGSILANTSIDAKLHTKFQSNVRDARSDEWFEQLHAQKEMGNGKYTLPVMAAAWAVGGLLDGNPIADVTGEWGERSIRGILIGAPPMLAMQYATGASRPGETLLDSQWKPFSDTNGVSGHSFMGALPFITAAKMTDRPLLKFALYSGSAIAPLSRVNDSAHYPSQVMLGWMFAYVAATAVDQTQLSPGAPILFPLVNRDAVGMGVEFRR